MVALYHPGMKVCTVIEMRGNFGTSISVQGQPYEDCCTLRQACREHGKSLALLFIATGVLQIFPAIHRNGNHSSVRHTGCEGLGLRRVGGVWLSFFDIQIKLIAGGLGSVVKWRYAPDLYAA